MKLLLLLFVLINIGLATNNAHANTPYCEWLSSATYSIAQSRNNGLAEFDLIENYLQQSQSYAEQKIILQLIDRVYQLDKSSTPTQVAYVEKQRCEIAYTRLSKLLTHN